MSLPRGEARDVGGDEIVQPGPGVGTADGQQAPRREIRECGAGRQQRRVARSVLRAVPGHQPSIARR